MKTLVTGATGLIGTRLCRRLSQEGHELFVLSRRPESVGSQLQLPCRAFAWDAMKGAPPAEAFEGVDAVIHLAGESVASGRWTAERKRKILESRQIGTRNLVEGIRKHGKGRVRSLISASAIGIYEDRGDELLEESAPSATGFLAEVCQTWEGEVRVGDSIPNLRTVMLRTGIVLDPKGGALGKLLPIFRMGLGGKAGSGRQWMSWIHVEDLVGLYLHALGTSSLRGPLNAVSPEPARNRDFAHILARTLKRPAILPVPALALKLALGEMAGAVLSGQRVSAKTALESGYRFLYPRLDDALENLLLPGRAQGLDSRIRDRRAG